jgi:hypothetical protein
MLPELKNTWTPAVNILTWFMLVTAILSVLTRLGTKYFIFRKWTFDDGLVTTSIVFCIAQSIAVSKATENGLGQHRDMLSDAKIESIMKVRGRHAFSRTIANATNAQRLNTQQLFYSSPAFASLNCRFWSSFAT